MNTQEPPHFPATALEEFSDSEWTATTTERLLADLAGVVDIDDADLERRTPCAEYTVGELRDHVVGWLQRFADALDDVQGIDPDTYHVGADAPEVVRQASRRIAAAVRGGALEKRHLVSSATMDGPAVAAMLIGEYIVHGDDLARATGQAWAPDAKACELAREFLEGMVTPEYRGPDGMFGLEVEVPQPASPLDRLLGFSGRDPHWQAA